MFVKTGHVLDHFLYIVGLSLVLFAYPLVFGLLLYYDYPVIDILEASGVMVEIRLLFALPLAIVIGLIGFWLWKIQLGSSRLTQQRSDGTAVSASQVRIWQIACFMTLFLVVVSILATLLAVIYAFLMVFFAYALSDYTIRDAQRLWLVSIILSNATLALGEFAIAFLVARFHWRLLQSTRVNRVVEKQPHADKSPTRLT